MSFEYSLQQAVYSALVADTSLMSAVNGVYDNIEQPADAGSYNAFPYVTIGEDTANDWSTDTSSGADTTITVHVWSQYQGRAEVKNIQGLIYNVLHRQPLVIAGFCHVTTDFLTSDSMMDADGITRHGVQTFRVIIDEGGESCLLMLDVISL